MVTVSEFNTLVWSFFSILNQTVYVPGSEKPGIVSVYVPSLEVA